MSTSTDVGLESWLVDKIQRTRAEIAQHANDVAVIRGKHDAYAAELNEEQKQSTTHEARLAKWLSSIRASEKSKLQLEADIPGLERSLRAEIVRQALAESGVGSAGVGSAGVGSAVEREKSFHPKPVVPAVFYGVPKLYNTFAKAVVRYMRRLGPIPELEKLDILFDLLGGSALLAVENSDLETTQEVFELLASLYNTDLEIERRARLFLSSKFTEDLHISLAGFWTNLEDLPHAYTLSVFWVRMFLLEKIAFAFPSLEVEFRKATLSCATVSAVKRAVGLQAGLEALPQGQRLILQ